uniref:Clade I nitrous oxide reductase n=1 Tax=Macrostomum lignano TaxID=282301 RepID=A0A1I8F744_9PLAT
AAVADETATILRTRQAAGSGWAQRLDAQTGGQLRAGRRRERLLLIEDPPTDSPRSNIYHATLRVDCSKCQ